MKQTKLVAAPVRQAEVPPRARWPLEPRTASQLIPGVLPTVAWEHEEAAPGVATARGLTDAEAAAAPPPRA
jgi:hypothetical protein